MQKGIRFRAYPNKEQEILINQTLGCCRLIYNKGLAMRNEAYAKGEKAGYGQTSYSSPCVIWTVDFRTSLGKEHDIRSSGVSTTDISHTVRSIRKTISG